jgi:hypothetical protein
LAIALSFAAQTSLNAQDLKSGEWSGVIVAPNGSRRVVTLQIAGGVEPLSIVMRSERDGKVFRLQDAQVKGDTLIFVWKAETVHLCSLLRQEDGAYEGACRDPEGVSDVIRMHRVRRLFPVPLPKPKALPGAA